MQKSKVYYIKKALELAEKDLLEIKERINKWLYVDTTSREKISEWLKLHESGYNGSDDTSKQVDIEMAIADLKNILWGLERKN